MPDVQLFGRFAVISSITEPCRIRTRRGQRVYGWRYMALMEIDPSLKPPSRIDPRIKSIKQIILLSESFGYYTHKGFHAFMREYKRYTNMAEKFDRLYPLHIMAKEWPLALPVYSE